jgi:hypothetical protein
MHEFGMKFFLGVLQECSGLDKIMSTCPKGVIVCQHIHPMLMHYLFEGNAHVIQAS